MAKLLHSRPRPQHRRIRNRGPRRHHTANQPLADGAVLARKHRTAREECVRARKSREPQLISKNWEPAREGPST